VDDKAVDLVEEFIERNRRTAPVEEPAPVAAE
jgi:hypothetical protein